MRSKESIIKGMQHEHDRLIKAGRQLETEFVDLQTELQQAEEKRNKLQKQKEWMLGGITTLQQMWIDAQVERDVAIERAEAAEALAERLKQERTLVTIEAESALSGAFGWARLCAKAYRMLQAERDEEDMKALDGLDIAEKMARALMAVAPSCGFIWETCGNCEEIGVWLYDDFDGQSWKCDKHKNDSYYHTEPELDEDMVATREALAEWEKWKAS